MLCQHATLYHKTFSHLPSYLPRPPTCSFSNGGQLWCTIVSVVQFVSMVVALSMRPLPVHLSVGSLRASCCALEILRARENLNLFGVTAGAPRETGRPGDRRFSWRHVRAQRRPLPRSNEGWRGRGVPRRHPCRSLFPSASNEVKFANLCRWLDL